MDATTEMIKDAIRVQQLMAQTDRLILKAAKKIEEIQLLRQKYNAKSYCRSTKSQVD